MARRAAMTRLRRACRVLHDRRGASAVEFAFVAPVLIVMLFGTDEMASVVMAQRRVTHATAEIGDLTSQYTTINAAQASDAAYSATWVLAPFPASNTSGSTTALLYQMRITSIMMDGASSPQPRVNWSCVPTGQTGLTAYTAGTLMTSLPLDSNNVYIMMTNSSTNSTPAYTSGDSIIMVESTYAYTSPLKYVIKSGLTFSKTFYYKPRESNEVILQAGVNSTDPTSSTTGWKTASSTSVSYSYSSTTSSPSLTCNYQSG